MKRISLIMKRISFIIILLGLCLFASCSRTNTALSVNENSAQTGSAGSGSANNFGAASSSNTNQANTGAPQEKSSRPQLTGLVNDYANVVDEATRARLEKVLNNLRERGKIDFAVVTIKTTGGEDISDYSLAMAREWGMGTQTGGGGLLLLLAVEDRKWRFQLTRSLEADLPNKTVAEFGRLMVEPFRAGKYGEGLTKCVEAIIARLSERRGFKLDESLSPPPRARKNS